MRRLRIIVGIAFALMGGLVAIPTTASATYSHLETCRVGLMGASQNDTIGRANTWYGINNWYFGVAPTYDAFGIASYTRYSDRDLWCTGQWVVDPKWAHGPGAGLLCRPDGHVYDERFVYWRSNGCYNNPWH